MTERVHYQLDENDVYIGRPSKWGNPFSCKPSKYNVKPAANDYDAINQYRQWITKGEGQHLLRDIYELRGKRLGCHCAPGKECHGDVLVELADMKKIAIIGCRDIDGKEWTDYQFLIDKMMDLWDGDYAVVSGGARGADKLGKAWAGTYTPSGIYIEYPADWNKHGRIAGILRNTLIIKSSDEVVAFWDGKSTGTRDSIRKAQQMKKPTHIYYI